jgi:hypothetical protein
MKKYHIKSTVFAVALFIFLMAAHVNGTSVVKRNLVELIQFSERILVGTVVNLTDGIEARTSAPYTEVTIQLSEELKGSFNGKIFTFRQFGLLKPRLTKDGKHTNLMVTPAGFPIFKTGEEVLLFLCKEGSATGFCTTVGLLQGKFNIENSKIVNGVYNQNLFQSVSSAGLNLTQEQKKLLSTKGGPVSAEIFISLVKQLSQNLGHGGKK